MKIHTSSLKRINLDPDDLELSHERDVIHQLRKKTKAKAFNRSGHRSVPNGDSYKRQEAR